MVKLTLEFKTLEEVGDFISGRSATPSEAKIENVSRPVEEKPSAKKKKYSDEDLINMTDDEADEVLKPAQKGKRTKLLKKIEEDAAKSVEEKAPEVPAQTVAADVMDNVSVPPVIEQPVAPATNAVDRDSLISKAQSLVNEIKTLGVEDTEIMPKLMQAYQAAGVNNFCRVSELPDEHLGNVVDKIDLLVQSLKSPQPQGSFV